MSDEIQNKNGEVKPNAEEPSKERKGLFHHECKHCERHKKEAEEFKAGWQRALADYRNLQREVEEWRSKWQLISEMDILEEFLPVFDNFKKAFNANFTNNEQDDTNGDRKFENWRKGIEYIMKQFRDVLKSHGVEELKTVGEKFDPKFHEAVGEEAPEPGSLLESVQSRLESGMVMREVEGGYMMKGMVAKPAKVIVKK